MVVEFFCHLIFLKKASIFHVVFIWNLLYAGSVSLSEAPFLDGPSKGKVSYSSSRNNNNNNNNNNSNNNNNNNNNNNLKIAA